MAPSDSTKVALGVLALAGIGIAVYLVCKQMRRKKKANGDAKSKAGSLKQDVPPPAAEEQISPDRRRSSDIGFIQPPATHGDTVPERQSDYEAKTQEGGAVPSLKSEESDKERDVPMSTAVSESVAAEVSTPISASLSSWEEVKPMSESFTEVKLPSDDTAEQQSAAGDTVTSQMGGDPMGSFTELGLSRDSWKDDAGAGDSHLIAESMEQAKMSGGESQTEGDPNGAGRNVQKESMVIDDIQSLQSDDTSNGEAQSFENINSSDEATSLAGSHGAEGGGNDLRISFHPADTQQEQMAGGLQSAEQVGSEGLSEKAAGNGDSLPSFEQISEMDSSGSVNPNESSIVVIKEQSGETDQTTDTQGAEEESQHQTEEKAQPEVEKSKEDVKLKRTRPLSTGDSSESLPSSELAKKSQGGSKEFYSSESLHSLATSASGSGSGSGRQDFYTPISSPATVDSSTDNVSFRSFDDSEVSEELTFYDLEASGRVTPQTPQDRTPTNTPVSQETGGRDAKSAEMQGEDTPSSRTEESLITDKTPKPSQEGGGDEGLKGQGDLSAKSQQQTDGEQAVSKTSPETESGGNGKPAQRSMLNIDKDKMTEAILQAQSHPDKMEIGHLQILVELLKQDDWMLLSTTLQCLISATAFTINVNILTVCECPKELTRLLEKFVPLLVSGADPLSQNQAAGAPTVKTLFLNVTRVINNLAMDIKSQEQLESSIPVLTDLLMTEGISESVTLASLQPLTNLSTNKAYHGHYTRLLQQLYSFLDTTHNTPLRLQCLKLLVNLSLNADMVPHMLAAKAPSCLLDLLDINYNVDLLLRTVTFLANIMSIMQEQDLSPSSLPPDEKAPSPETLHSALFALDRRDALRNKVYRLTRHESEDVCYQASRLYKLVVSSK